MNTILMNSGNSKTSGPHRLLLHILDKINWKGSDKYVPLSNISIYYAWKNHTKTIDLKYQFQCGTKNLNYLTDHILHQILQIILIILSKNMKPWLIILQIRIYVTKTENRITFRTKTGYYLELLTPAAMKLFGSTKNKITEDDNFESVPHLSKMIINMIWESYIHLLLIMGHSKMTSLQKCHILDPPFPMSRLVTFFIVLSSPPRPSLIKDLEK